MPADGHEPLARHALAFVLAGERQSPDGTNRSASQTSCLFRRKSRIIDFALSNAVNSWHSPHRGRPPNTRRIVDKTPADGLELLSPRSNESFDILPASQRVSETNWYLGRRMPFIQNIDIIEPHRARFIVLLAGDHVYKMTTNSCMPAACRQRRRPVGCLEMPRLESSGFGIMQVDQTHHPIIPEKPADPPPMPGKPDKSLASMGIYVFDTKFLIDELRRDDDGSEFES